MDFLQHVIHELSQS